MSITTTIVTPKRIENIRICAARRINGLVGWEECLELLAALDKKDKLLVDIREELRMMRTRAEKFMETLRDP